MELRGSVSEMRELARLMEREPQNKKALDAIGIHDDRMAIIIDALRFAADAKESAKS